MLNPGENNYILKGLAAQQATNWDDAHHYYRLALKSEPSIALYLLAELAYAQQDYGLTLNHLSSLLDQEPNYTLAYLLLGRSHFRQSNFRASEQAYQQYIHFCPDDYRGYLGQAEIWRVLKNVFKHSDYLQQALSHCSVGKDTQVQEQMLLHLALNDCFLGHHRRARHSLQILIDKYVDQTGFPHIACAFPQLFWKAHIAYLSSLYADPEISDQELFTSIQTGLKLLPEPEPGLIQKRKDHACLHAEPLKVAYLSREFGPYTSMQLLAPLLDGSNYLYYAYHDVPTKDLYSIAETVPESLSSRFDAWRSVGHLDHFSLARQIQADGIHILVDLGGFTHAQRHPMLAYRPAPIQITGPGFLFTAAHQYADYCFSDPVMTPPDLAVLYPETILELESVFHICQPEALPIHAPPHLSNGFVTLGSANAPHKLNAEVIKLWSEILLALPDSCLFLKNAAFDAPEMKAYFEELFVRQGVPSESLRFEGACPEAQAKEGHLSYFYRQIDIALDPFPYQGGVNSFEALWMGVPLLVMAQEQWRSRALSLSILNAIGLSDWAVFSERDYLQRCLDWTSDSKFLQEQRSLLRAKLIQSTLCDARHGDKIAKIYQSLWNDYCAEN